MNALASGLRLATVLVTLGAVSAYAAQQMIPTQRLFVRNPDVGGDATKRRMFFKSKSGLGSLNTVVGDPMISGATLHVRLASGVEQCFDLPPAGWSAISTLGFVYTDFDGPGAVTKASIKRGPSGVMAIKMSLSGRLGPLDIIPTPGETGFDVNIALVGGDEYCAGGSTPPGATSTDKVYKANNLSVPGSCGVTACAPGF